MIRLAIILIILIQPIFLNAQQQTRNYRVLKLMGTRFELSAVSNSEEKSRQGVEAGIYEIRRIEKLISSWDPGSQTSMINRNAGIEPVKVDKELYDLIYRSIKISRLTGGAFDISFASIDNLWKFDGSMRSLPDPKDIETSVVLINYENIILNPDDQTVFLKESGMKIGFGAIGKGYAANRAKKVMKEMGIENGVVNAAGDLIIWGQMEGGKDWKIGISKPDQSNEMLAWLSINNMAVVTSGDYEKFMVFDGKRYAHIIDPRTGYPTTGIKSVSIFCPDAELADGLATSVFVLGREEGLKLINQLRGIECMIITDNNELFTSDNLDLNYYKPGKRFEPEYDLRIGIKKSNNKE